MKKINLYAFKIIALAIILCVYTFTFNLVTAEQLQPETPNNLITLDVKELDLKDVLKIISQASGLNIIMDNDVKAKISITLTDVPWQTALENVLKINELTYKIHDNIIRIMTQATLRKEEETSPISTRILTLNFAKAADLQQSLNKILSSRGNIQINVNTNSLIITDTPDILNKIEDLANKLDIRTPQVIIERY